MRFFKFKRLKIVEQIVVVVCFAVLIPLTVSGVIINNINQQAVRYQLRESAVLIANMISDEIDFFSNTINTSLEQIEFSLKYIKGDTARQQYLNSIAHNFENCEKIQIAKSTSELLKIHENNKKVKKATISINLDDGEFLVATYSLEGLRDELFQSLKDDKRQIYVMTNDGVLIASHNYTDELFQETLSMMPKHQRIDEPVIFGDVKNQPIVYVKRIIHKLQL